MRYQKRSISSFVTSCEPRVTNEEIEAAMRPMTLERARELLGEEESAKFADEELQQLIWDLEAIARMTIKAIIRGEFKMPPDGPSGST